MGRLAWPHRLTESRQTHIIEKVMRLRAAFAVILTAGLCSTTAPVVHVHMDHDGDHHAALVVHAHFGVHHRDRSPTSTLSEHESNATYYETVAAAPAAAHSSVQLVALPIDVPAVPEDARVAIWSDNPIASVHDPPLSNPALRAPPAFSPDLVLV